MLEMPNVSLIAARDAHEGLEEGGLPFLEQGVATGATDRQ
jgi:hypothetical protein